MDYINKKLKAGGVEVQRKANAQKKSILLDSKVYQLRLNI